MSDLKFQKPASTPPIGLLKLMLKMGVKPPAPDPIPYPDNWCSLTGEDKFDFFKTRMLSTEHHAFVSQEVAQTYVSRAQNWLDAVAMKDTGVVPNFFMGGAIVEEYAGITQAEKIYDGEKAAKAYEQFVKEFNPEYNSLALGMSGDVLDMLGVNIMRWPGGKGKYGLPENTPFQYLEKESMPVEEYDQLINNPEGYLLHTFYPRIFDNLKGFSALTNLFSIIEPAVISMFLIGLGMGPAREALDTLLQAADTLVQYMMPSLLTGSKLNSQFGTPSSIGGFSLAPYDIVADTMRGTKGAMMDMYRHPEKLIAACDAVTPSAIQIAIQTSMMSGCPYIFIPLHKGADGFMSNQQFEKFYWPSFKKLLLGLVDAGLVPFPFVEGAYNQRLDIIADSGLPEGRMIWWFDQTDMKAAKDKIGKFSCIAGNVPTSLFATGTAQDMERYCKDLIEYCAPGGGFILGPGAVIDHARKENVRAFINSTK